MDSLHLSMLTYNTNIFSTDFWFSYDLNWINSWQLQMDCWMFLWIRVRMYYVVFIFNSMQSRQILYARDSKISEFNLAFFFYVQLFFKKKYPAAVGA